MGYRPLEGGRCVKLGVGARLTCLRGCDRLWLGAYERAEREMRSMEYQLREELRGFLKGRELDGEVVDRLVGVLSPSAGQGDRWPSIELVLWVVEQAVVAERLESRELPEVLEGALEDALRAAAPMLGERYFGPVEEVARRARQRFDAERRKYELVRGKIEEGMGRARAARMLRNYLETGPAPVFVSRLRMEHAGLMVAAEEASFDLGELEALAAGAWVEEMMTGRGAAEEVAVRLSRVAQKVDVRAALLSRAIEKGERAQVAVAAALAGWVGAEELAPSLLARAAVGAEPTALLAVVGGMLAPLMARHLFAQLLADASWNNPEEPEQELTEARSAAIITARCVLPFVGSPLSEVVEMELSAHVRTSRLEGLPAEVRRQWLLWDAVLSEGGAG